MPTEPLAGGAPPNDPPRWFTDEEQRAWRAYIRLAQLLMHQLDRDLHPFGLSMHDYEILVELSEAPGNRMRMTELADRTAQSRSRLSHQVNRMEARGLVSREGCEGDKRGTFAVITGRGAAAITKVAPYHVASVREHFMDQLDPAQLAALTAAYEPVLEKLRTVRDRD
ncbi:MAG TPA: MarR family transcriptional regulator [Trebonia sp.]|nr:MarR family transcriptional regulator [Trebonia sp.]